jgi:hypothetical protein
MSMELHELTGLMQQLTILNWDYYTIKIGLRRIQNLCHQSFVLGPVQPQELTMETTDSPDKQIVGANGIPRGCMSFPQGHPIHLLRQTWTKVDCSWTSCSWDVSRQSRWILKQCCNADFEVYAKRIQHHAHLIKHLKEFMPNDGHKAQSNKVQTILAT